MNSRAVADGLVGRDAEQRLIDAWVDGADVAGAAAVVRGPAGSGRSALLAHAAALAQARGMPVLAAVGAPSEADLPFSGLQQVLQPLLDHTGPALHVRQLMLGGEQKPAHVLQLGMSVLALLATAAPALLCIDDAQWLDPASARVLAFVSRRLSGERLVLLAATSDGRPSGFDTAGLIELRLGPLAPADAAHLLDREAADLPDALRDRLLAEAAGNPLAIVELARGAAGELSPRLEEAFAGPAEDLPAAARALLLVLATDAHAPLDELVAAATLAGEGPVAVEDVSPAVDARLIEVRGSRVRFTHPLMPRAIRQRVGVARRLAAHRALADVLDEGDERAVWHRAAACVGRDEEVAAALEALAGDPGRHLSASCALSALERAAELSEQPAARGRRLLQAARRADELGRDDTVQRLLAAAMPLLLRPVDRARVSVFAEIQDLGGSTARPSLPAFVAIARELHRAGDTDEAVGVLITTAVRCWWGLREPEARDVVFAAAEGMLPAGDPRLVAIGALTQPTRRGRDVLRRLAALGAGDAHPSAAHVLGFAALAVGAPDRAVELFGHAIDGLGREELAGPLSRALVVRSWSQIVLGDVQAVSQTAPDTIALCDRLERPLWASTARLALATARGLAGDEEHAEALIEQAVGTPQTADADELLSLVLMARGCTALAAGRPAEACETLGRMHDPADPAYHPRLRFWSAAPLLEAALSAGRPERAADLLHELELLAEETGFPVLERTVLAFRPLLADAQDAGPAFEAALAGDLTGWPMLSARLRLGHGEWLRRRRRPADARAPLRAARDEFASVGLEPPAARAAQELRATGETVRRASHFGWDDLTAQETTIARMAAAGLTNREIGRQLFLSHRTVGSHLYRIFPKLGVASRGELAQALSQLEASP